MAITAFAFLVCLMAGCLAALLFRSALRLGKLSRLGHAVAVFHGVAAVACLAAALWFAYWLARALTNSN